jgi:hypothetical protein
VCFLATCRDDSAAENLGYDLSRVARTVHSIVSELIRRKALRVEGAKAGFVAKKRAAGHGHTTGEKELDRRIEPEHRSSGGPEKLRTARLSVGATAERQHCSLLEFSGSSKGGAELIRFDLAKRRLAKTLENLRNEEPGEFLNSLIEINESPGELTRKKRTDSGLTGAHESGEAKKLRARGRTARRNSLSHWIE